MYKHIVHFFSTPPNKTFSIEVTVVSVWYSLPLPASILFRKEELDLDGLEYDEVTRTVKIWHSGSFNNSLFLLVPYARAVVSFDMCRVCLKP